MSLLIVQRKYGVSFFTNLDWQEKTFIHTQHPRLTSLTMGHAKTKGTGV